ncbi:hypothetical protein NMY22_g17192 [Coprinellus aureogranulatus]|nr:hypothetical protein NMY22_g17192 [Coprinellus aureogranulatus]
MSMNERLVSVDDADPESIKWDGPWFSTQGNMDDWGNNGPPFLSTLHGITTNGSFSFRFKGRSVAVWGSLRPSNISLGYGPDPDWDCIVDGNNTGKPWGYPVRPFSNFALCNVDGVLSDGDHSLEVRATVQSETLWIDQVQYRASLDTDISTAWTEVRHGDGRFKYSGDWRERPDGYGIATTTNGAWVTYEFSGEGVVFGGYTTRDTTAVDGLAVYVLDDLPPIQFAIPSTGVTRSNQPYFSITDMKPGQHRLEITNKGNFSTAPLAFSYFYTKNAKLPASPTPSATKSSNLPKIIGGAVGGGLGLILLAVVMGFIFVLNRNRRRREEAKTTIARVEKKLLFSWLTFGLGTAAPCLPSNFEYWVWPIRSQKHSPSYLTSGKGLGICFLP